MRDTWRQSPLPISCVNLSLSFLICSVETRILMVKSCKINIDYRWCIAQVIYYIPWFNLLSLRDQPFQSAIALLTKFPLYLSSSLGQQSLELFTYVFHFSIYTYFSWPRHPAYRILVPINNLQPSAVEALSLHQWTTREVLLSLFLWIFFFFLSSLGMVSEAQCLGACNSIPFYP